jgi:hypothetical protein
MPRAAPICRRQLLIAPPVAKRSRGSRATAALPKAAKLSPIAVATEAPTRSDSFSTSSPASASACRAAATTSCAKRPIRLARRCSIHRVGSKSPASQANLTMNSRGSNAVIGPAAERPLTKCSQLVATSLANGVTAPSPVITTLRRPLAPISPPGLQFALDEEHHSDPPLEPSFGIGHPDRSSAQGQLNDPTPFGAPGVTSPSWPSA